MGERDQTHLLKSFPMTSSRDFKNKWVFAALQESLKAPDRSSIFRMCPGFDSRERFSEDLKGNGKHYLYIMMQWM